MTDYQLIPLQLRKSIAEAGVHWRRIDVLGSGLYCTPASVERAKASINQLQTMLANIQTDLEII
jgi:hypothetical protein